ALPSAFVAGRVAGADGKAPRSMQVLVSCAALHWTGLFPVSAADGSFRIGPLPPGRYALATHDNLGRWPEVAVEPFDLAARATRDVGTLRPVAPCTLDLQIDRRALPPGTRVFGHVLDRDGQVVVNLL